MTNDNSTDGTVRYVLDGSDYHKIESALEDCGFDATIIEDSGPSMVSSTDRPATEVRIHLERETDTSDH